MGEVQRFRGITHKTHWTPNDSREDPVVVHSGERRRPALECNKHSVMTSKICLLHYHAGLRRSPGMHQKRGRAREAFGKKEHGFVGWTK